MRERTTLGNTIAKVHFSREKSRDEAHELLYTRNDIPVKDRGSYKIASTEPIIDENGVERIAYRLYKMVDTVAVESTPDVRVTMK